MVKEIKYLEDMYNDSYFPNFLVDKIKALLEGLVTYLEEGSHTNEAVQSKLDEVVVKINDLQEEFDAQGSEIETAARESIGETIDQILAVYQIDIELEEAIRKRDW